MQLKININFDGIKVNETNNSFTCEKANVSIDTSADAAFMQAYAPVVEKWLEVFKSMTMNTSL